MVKHNVSFGFALEYVTDISAATRFLTNVLGLEVERDSPSFVQFRAANGASYAVATDEPMDRGDAPELWWVVDDATAAYTEMSANAKVGMPLRQLPFGTCFGIKDPSGQTHYLVQFAANRPSVEVA